MKKRKCAIFVLALIFIFTSCTPANNNEIKEQIVSKSDDDMLQSAERQLTVYCEDGIALFTNATREYEQLTDTDVNLVLFEDVTEMESRITTESLSGGGPDVYLFNSDNSLDIQKMMKNGAFYELNKLMEDEMAYGGYKEEDYYPCMIEAGRYGDRQYILPFSFGMLQFYADSSVMNTYYPALQDGYDMQEFLGMLKEECVRVKDTDDYTNIIWGKIWSKYFLNTLLEQSQMEYLNYEERQVALDEATVEEMAEFWKTWIETQKLDEILQTYMQSNELVEHCSFYAETTSVFNTLRHNVACYRQCGIEPYFAVLPAWGTENTYTATICEFGAVNANTAYPEESYQLLRSIMDYQVNYDFNKTQFNLSYNLPVQKSNLHTCLQNVVQLRGKGGFEILPLTDEYEKQLEDILANITDAVIPNPKVGSIVNEVMQPYFMGEEEFDICYTKLENRLKLYLSE
ncbi:MAG: hypothetical protein J6J86_09880 [Lachnospiraceae bacterium]|nr:hypothetical protein [Lachnospiraceae bacterium]